MLKYGLGFLMLLALGLAAFAQPNPDEPLDPNNPQGGGDRNQQRMMALLMARMMDNMPAIQKATPDGIFTVRHGVLLKSDPATLKTAKGTFILRGAEAAKLAAERAAGATRIAVFGTFTKPVDPKTSAGTLDLQAYLVLSTAK
jgi:hypothetical protein